MPMTRTVSLAQATRRAVLALAAAPLLLLAAPSRSRPPGPTR